jgi:hypothetical protein
VPARAGDPLDLQLQAALAEFYPGPTATGENPSAISMRATSFAAAGCGPTPTSHNSIARGRTGNVRTIRLRGSIRGRPIARPRYKDFPRPERRAMKDDPIQQVGTAILAEQLRERLHR